MLVTPFKMLLTNIQISRAALSRPFCLEIFRKVRDPMLNPWLALSFKVFQLGIEAQSVVALRMMRLASGGAGTQAEMGRMMVEKAAAVTEAQFAAATMRATGPF